MDATAANAALKIPTATMMLTVSNTPRLTPAISITTSRFSSDPAESLNQ